MTKLGGINKQNLSVLFGNKIKMNKKLKKVIIVFVALFMVSSIIPVMAAEGDVTITIKFVDQNDNDLNVLNERVLIDGVGWKENGQTFTIPASSTVYYRAYFSSGSGLYGPKLSYVAPETGPGILEVRFMSMGLNFIDQDENTITAPTATNAERVYIDHVGYQPNGNTLVIPMDSTIYYRAYYNQGSGLYGPKLNIHTDLIEDDKLNVEFITFEVEFTPGLTYTDDERVHIDHIGYKANGDPVTVPKDSTIYYRMYYKAGSGLYGTKNNIDVETGNVDFDHNFKAINMNFVDQTNGDVTTPPASGEERVHIDHVGYKANGDIVVVPDDSTLYYRAYYKAGSGLYGPKLSVNVEDLISTCGALINPSNSDLVAYLKFEDGSGTTALDSTINNNDGTVNGGATWTTGRIGDALEFDGLDDYVEIPDSSSLDIATTISIEVWIKPDTVYSGGNWQYDDVIVGKKLAYYLRIDETGKLGFYVYGPPNGDWWSGSSTNWLTGSDMTGYADTWVHIAATYDGTTAKLYINGAEDVSEARAGSIQMTNQPLRIGYVDYNRYFDGLIDELIIWDEVLSAHDIQTHYLSGLPDAVSYWPFEKGSGPTAYDESDNNNDGTINGATWTSSCVGGNALSFDGVDDYVEVADDSSLDIIDGLTISAWINHKDNNVWDGILQKGSFSDSFGNYEIHLTTSNNLRFIINNADYVAMVTGTININPDTWYHVAATYDKVNMKIYVNGVLDGATPYTDPITTDDHPLRIGMYYSDDFHFKGIIDEVSVYDIALAEHEVKALYYLSLPEPVALWHMNEGAGSTAYDETGNANDGTVNDATWTSLGKYGSALNFDGNDDYMSVPNDPVFDLDSQGSWFAWIKLDHHVGNIVQHIVTVNQGGVPNARQWALEISNTNKLQMAIRESDNSKWVSVTDSQVFPVDQWVYVGATYDKNSNPSLILYRDGNPVASNNLYHGDINTGTGAELRISSDVWEFNGIIDEVAIWNCGLSGDAINHYYKMNQEHLLDQELTTCNIATLNVEFVSLSLNFVDQDGPLMGNPAATSNEKVHIDHVGYRANGDIVLVPKNAPIYYRAYYKSGSGLYGPKDHIVVDGSFDILDVQFKTIELNFVASELSGDEKVHIDHIGYKGNSDRFVVPLYSTIYYKAYYKSSSGLYGPKLNEYVDCDEDVLDVEFWSIRLKVVWAGTDDLVLGAQVYVDHVGYVANDGIITVPVGSTIYHKANVGNTWSAKTGKLVDKTWNTIVYEWDESSFSSPAYNTEVTFKFYDQNGILSDSLGYTGDERVYVHTISSYLNDGGSAAVAAGKTIAYSAYYKTGGLHGSVRYTTSLIEYVMFQTAIFNFKDQDGELVGTGLEKVYVHSVAAYFMDEDPITVPLDSTIGYSAYYTTGGLHGTVIHKTITNTVEIIDVLYQTFTFVFKDQDGNLLAGTGNERVYLHSISSYVNKNIEVSVPLDSSIAYSAYYTSSGLHGPVQHKTIDNSVEVIDVAYQIFSFEFKDQNGDYFVGTGNERVYVHSIAKYVNKNEQIVVPLDSNIAYAGYYTMGGLHGPVQYMTIGSGVETIDVFFQIFSFEFKDQNGDGLSSIVNERVYVHSIGAYVEDGEEIIVPLDSNIAYTAYYTTSGLHGPVLYKKVETGVTTIDVFFQIFTFQFKDQFGNDLVGTGNEQVYVHSIGIYVNDNEAITVPVDANIAFTAYYTSGGLHGPVLYQSISVDIEEIEVLFRKIMFDFKDLSGEDLEGTGDESVYVHSVGLYYEDGAYAVYPLDSTISYQAYFSPGVKSGTIEHEDIDTQNVIIVIFNIYNNKPPVADAGLDQEVDEGDNVEFDGSLTDDPDVGDVLTYEWDFGDPSDTTPGIGINPSHTYGDDGVYTVTLTVTDDHDASDTDTMTVTVLNAAPTAFASSVGLNAFDPVDEGSVATVMITESDPGSSDGPFTYSFDWDNDGNYEIVDQDDNYASHTWCDDGSYTVGVGVRDKDGGFGEATTTVIVENVAPTADADGPYSGFEGSPITFTGTATDPGCDDLTFTWDWGDGSDNTEGTYFTNGEYLDSSVAGLWHLDEGTGDTAYDTTLNDNDGLINGATWTSGVSGSALDFDGTDDFVEVPDSVSLDITGAITVESWVNIDQSIYPHSYFVSKDTTGQRSYGLGMDGGYYAGKDYVPFFIIFHNSGSPTFVWGSSPLSTDTWHHLAGTYDPSTGVAKIYVNGVEAGSSTTTPGRTIFSSNAGLEMGAREYPGTWRSFMDGTLDEVAIHSRAISASEILEHYQQAPISRWTFDEGFGTTAHDSIDGNDGTLTNGPVWTSGIDGSALEFDGINDVVIIPDDNSLSFGDSLTDEPFSISAWTYMNDATEFSIISKFDGSPNNEWLFSTNSDDRMVLALYDQNGPDHIARVSNIGSETSRESKWTHYAATYDGSSSSSGLRIYRNGERIDTSDSNKGTYVAMHNTATEVEIGSTHGGVLNWWADGLIEEVAIFDTELSQDLIKVLYSLNKEGCNCPFTATDTLEHTYANDGVYTVTLTVTDGDGGSTLVTTTATVDNVAPSVFAGHDMTINEGSTASFSFATATDPGDDTLTYDWDFGDGAISLNTVLNPTHTYTQDDSYTVTLTVSDDDTFTTDTLTVTVQNVAPSVFAGHDMTINEGAAVSFSLATATDPGADSLKYDWDFGDGTKLLNTVLNPTHTYIQDGEYTATLTVRDDDTSTTDSLTITVNNVAPNVFAGHDISTTEGSLVTFSFATATDPGDDTLTYDWDFGDGTIVTNTVLKPTHTYIQDGSYTATLTVHDDTTSTSDSLTVTVLNVAPNVFAGHDITTSEGSIVTFSFATANDPGDDDLTYDWNFGDGPTVTDTDLNPTHTYTQDDTYTATLTVHDDDTSTSDSLTVTVKNVAPNVFAGHDITINEGSTVSFLFATANDPGNDDLTCDWNFGDGPTVTGTVLNPTHTYTQDGSYTATLTVHDDDTSTSDSLTVTVKNVAPNVFAGHDITTNEGSLVTFAFATATDVGDDTLTYDWDFGDTKIVTNTDLKPTHTYAQDGTYTATLKVYDDDTFTTDTLTVNVQNVAPNVFAGHDITINEGATLSFSFATATDPGDDDLTYDWDFGDGTTATDTDLKPTHTYTQDDIYTATLTVHDDDTSTTDTLTVTVQNVAPNVFAGHDITTTEGSLVTFSLATATDPGDDMLTYDWDFGDGTIMTNTVLDPTHTYIEDGIYTAELTVHDDDTSTSDTLSVTVANAVPIVSAGNDQTTTEGTTIYLDPATFTDAGILDTHTATINWGDGTEESGTVSESDGSGTVSGSHSYVDNGIYIVTITVEDDDSDVDSDTLTVTVNNVPPAVYFTSDHISFDGYMLTIDGAYFTDPGVSDTHTATIDWGDGNLLPATVDETSGSGTVSGSHPFIYGIGSPEIVITLTDNDGGIGSASVTITIDPGQTFVDADNNQLFTLGDFPIPDEWIEDGFFSTDESEHDYTAIPNSGLVIPPSVSLEIIKEVEIRAANRITVSGTVNGDGTCSSHGAKIKLISMELVIPGTITADSGTDSGQKHCKSGKITIVNLATWITETGVIKAKGDGSGGKGGEIKITTQSFTNDGTVSVAGSSECYECGMGKCKGITSLTLSYSGVSGVDITVNEGVVTDNGGGTYTITPETGKEKLSANTKIYVDSEFDAEIHTSCSKPLDIDDVYGSFTVSDMEKIYETGSCCKKCKNAHGGKIKIDTSTFSNSGTISANAYGKAHGGKIEIKAQDSFTNTNTGTIEAHGFGEEGCKGHTHSGDIHIHVKNGDLENNGEIAADNKDSANGHGGKIHIHVEGNFLSTGKITTDTCGPTTYKKHPKGGKIYIDVFGGDFTLSKDGVISADNKEGANGHGGKVDIEVSDGELICAGSITAENYGLKGDHGYPKGGTVYLDVTNGNFHLLKDGTISVDNKEGANGKSGTIDIDIKEGSFTNEGKVTADTYGAKDGRGSPKAGKIYIKIENGNFVNSDTISACSKNTAETAGHGGKIKINVECGEITSSGTVIADSDGLKSGKAHPKGGEIKLETDMHMSISGLVSAIATKYPDKYEGKIKLHYTTNDFSGATFMPVL